MAKGILGVEISTTDLRYGFVDRRHRRACLVKWGKIPLSADDRKDAASLSKKILFITSSQKLAPQSLCLSLSGGDVVTSQINLPKMDSSDLSEVIRSEVERIPQFSEMDFDYAFFPTRIDDARMSVVFCAVDKKNLQKYIAAAQSSGLYLENVEFSPVNFIDLMMVRGSLQETEGVIILDDHSSYILIIHKGECRFFFQMATGKSDLYGFSQTLDKGVCGGWTGEIRRVMKSYMREYTEKSLERLWLVWDHDGAMDLKDNVAVELGMEVLVPKPDDFGFHVDRETVLNPISLLSVTGPLLQMSGSKRRFNFKHFVSGVRRGETRQQVVSLVVIYLVAVVTVLFFFGGQSYLRKKNLEKRARVVAKELSELEEKTAQLKNERDQFLVTRDHLLRQASFVRKLNRVSWSEIFTRISQLLPSTVSLSLFDVSAGQDIKLEGMAVSVEHLAQMMEDIGGLPFADDAKFNYMREKEKDGKRFVEFGVTTRIKEESTDVAGTAV